MIMNGSVMPGDPPISSITSPARGQSLIKLCRALEEGDSSLASENFVSALESENRYSLEKYWGLTATELVHQLIDDIWDDDSSYLRGWYCADCVIL